MRSREENAFGSGFVSDLLLTAGDSPSGESVLAAYRPAGTREALPGTMRRTCVLRFESERHDVSCPYEENLGACEMQLRAENLYGS